MATFERTSSRHRFTAREGVVVDISRPADAFVRVTLGGPELADFASTGPADHARVFFPHPITGELVAPRPVGPDQDGIERSDAPMFARDFTPLNPRDDGSGGRLVDLDILRHVDPGPAAAWAETARPGDRLVLVGPRGSRDVPRDAERAVLVVDGTALPSATRWLAQLPQRTAIDVIADVPGDLAWVESYLTQESGRDAFELVRAGGDLGDAIDEVGVDASTFVFGAGEASRLVPLRRRLRHELGLPREQYALSGYWKRGMVAFDHHEPLDPLDPD
jgi:NADPH-dependent ferric siderophore reductase